MLKALSVRQPWASLIAEGFKTIEVRSRKWSYRGPLVICATARPDPGVIIPDGDGRPLALPCGVAVGVVELADCRPLAPCDAEAAHMPWGLTHLDCAGRWAWVLANAREVRPVSVKGQLSPWDWYGPELVVVSEAL